VGELTTEVGTAVLVARATAMGIQGNVKYKLARHDKKMLLDFRIHISKGDPEFSDIFCPAAKTGDRLRLLR
jgi:hypothetical protein